MDHHPVNARWQSEMSAYFEPVENGTMDDNLAPLAEVFHLD
jgi:L-rhamnose mutarotase